MSPAKAHLLRMTAAQLSKQNGTAAHVNASGYALMLHKLAGDKRRLKQIQSLSRKIDAKREMLPDYAPWISGALSAQGGAQDEVLMTVMVWMIDTGNFTDALPIVRYALQHKLTLPDQYQRTLACLVVEEMADTAMSWRSQGESIEVAGLLEVLTATQNEDMPDQVKAKLFKAIAYGLSEQDKPAAVDYFQQALALHDKCGVKKDLEKLQREIKNTAAEPAS
ncbi:phage terminase small subunit [Iodobacter sp. CM08]|uniref:phage terminase small subunit n=1 Tax=Iodobacter sp. CM08 TaxID=3085902 RepID=UPI002982B05D|nr:phage terminase small subunit [Iodobacter sp. CM08]MDW5418889.1 phage terminase small subunit [Iodobacter sp. CM08]